MMRENGWTLIELVIVLVVVGILAAVIVTDAVNSTSSARLGAAQWRLKSDLSYAQSLAVTQQVNHGIIFFPAQESYSVYRQNTGAIVKNPLKTDSNLTVNFTADNYLNGVDLVSTNFGFPTTNQVEFNYLGIPSDGTNNLTADGSIALNFNGANIVITVTKNTGKIN